MKPNLLIRAALVVLICVFCSTTEAQVGLTGGKGMLRVYEAETVTPGRLYVNPFATFFARQNAEQTRLDKDYTLNVGLTLGISPVIETFVHVVPYQTDTTHIWGAPGDTKLGLKLHLPRPGSVSQFGLAAYADFPTGRTHPLPFEPYSEDAFGYAILGLVSFNFQNAIKAIPLKLSANLGYKSHNAQNGFFSGVTDQIVGGFGFKIPFQTSLIYTEVTGEYFFNNNDVQFSHNFFRITQGYKFITRPGLVFDIAVDVEVGNYQPAPEQLAHTPRVWEDYADWKIILGMTYRNTLIKSWDRRFREAQKKEQQEQEKREQLREKREKVIKELEDYKKQLEEEKQREIPF